jgi:membrane protein DedA with SNARE-associated domain
MGAMDLAALLHHYGYLLILLGTFAEGETLLVLGGYFAQRGYLDLRGVIATAFVAAICGDQMFFHLGRRHAHKLFQRFPHLHDKVRIALHKAERHQNLVVLAMRFLWGLRIALPVSMGMTQMNAQKFFWLNLLSAAVWSVLFACVGYGTSQVFEGAVADLHHYELWIAAGLLLLGAIVLAIRWLSARRPERLGDSEP